MEKITVLYIAPKPPFPTVDGGCTAMQQLLENLNFCSVEVCVFSTEKHPFTEASKDYFNRISYPCKVIALNTKLKIIPMLFSILIGRSYHLSRFYSVDLLDFVKKNNHRFDYIVCDSLYAAYSLKELPYFGQKVIVRSHNIEHEIWQTTKKNTSGLKKWVLNRLTKSLESEEFNVLKQAKKILSITEKEKLFWKSHGINSVEYLPVSVSRAERCSDMGNSCFFLGSMNWKPNIESVDFLMNKLWVRGSLSAIPLHIAGSYSENIQPGNNAIIVHGRVENSIVFMQKTGILIAPVFSGSGIKIKILEALSAGCVVITNEKGAEGILADQAGILIAESVEEFEKWILAVSEDEVLRRECSEKGREYIGKYHDKSTIQQQLKTYLES